MIYVQRTSKEIIRIIKDNRYIYNKYFPRLVGSHRTNSLNGYKQISEEEFENILLELL